MCARYPDMWVVDCRSHACHVHQPLTFFWPRRQLHIHTAPFASRISVSQPSGYPEPDCTLFTRNRGDTWPGICYLKETKTTILGPLTAW